MLDVAHEPENTRNRTAGRHRHTLVACHLLRYTLALVSILGALGFAITINNAIWAGAIVTFAVLAVIGLALGYRRHRKPAPLIIGLTGAALISYTMLADYSRVIELSGFALLALAAFWDWRGKNR
ncbi:MAG: MerC domain-containing protein [Amylibacter sp.]|nr:MerC domain-containing protein [Amylibacter sp.]